MANIDGDITLSVALNPGNVKATAKDIQKEITGIFAKTKGQDLGNGFKQAQAAAVRFYDSMESISNKMDAVVAKTRSLSGKTDAKSVAKVAALRAEYNRLLVQLNQVTNSATIAVNRMEELSDLKSSFSVTQKLKVLGTTLLNIIRTAKNVITFFGTGIKTLHKTLDSAVGIVKKFDSAIKGLHKSTHRSNNALELGFKKLVQYGFGIRTVFLLVKKLRQALIDGMSSMTQYSADFNSVVSAFVSALATLKLAFATAFAPIASVALPLLTGLMNALVDAMNLIGKFFAALTGKSTFIQAKRVQKDYAASLEKTGKSGGSAAKGIKKADKAAKDAQKTIAGFDDVEILHENKDTDTGSSGGSGGGAGGAGTGDLTGADMFETVGIESKIRDFANTLRDLISAQDWTGLGMFLGQCINTVFEKARDIISWENIGKKIEFIVTAITKTFNGLVDSVDWELIGNTIAEGINTVIRTFTLLYEGINWGNLGTKLAKGLTRLFTDIDWNGLGILFSTKINSIIDLLYNFFANIDFKGIAKKMYTGFNTMVGTIKWKKIGATFAKAVNGVVTYVYTKITTIDWSKLSSSLMTSINTAMQDIDWGNIGATLAEFFKGALAFITTALVNFDWESSQQAIFDFARGFVTGIYNGIVDMLKDVGTWIYDNVFTPIIEGFKSAFGIASPSTVMEEQGGYIIEGLYNGIVNAWSSIVGFFSGGVTSIINLIKDAKWNKAGQETVTSTQKGASKKWSGLTKFFTGGVKGIIDDFKNANWKGTGETSIEKTQSGISNRWSRISSFFNTNTGSIISKFKNSDWKGTGETSTDGIQKGVTNKWSGLAKYFETGVSNIGKYITNFKWATPGNNIVTKLRSGIHDKWDTSIHSYVKTKITNIVDYIKNTNWSGVGSNIVTGLKGGMSGQWANVTSFFTEKINAIKNKFNDTNWSGIGENICSGISRGMSNGWSWVTNKAKELAKAAYDAARDKLEINSPSKLFRDGVGMAIPEGLAAGIDKGSDMALTAVRRLSESIGDTGMPDIEIPSIAIGKVIPYESGKTTNSVDTTLADVASLLKSYHGKALTREDLETALRNVLPSMLREYISFYIGDEDVARHANAGNDLLNRRFNPSTTG